MKLPVFADNTRLPSFNRQLATCAAAMARVGDAEVTQLELASLDIPLYNADLEAHGTRPDVMRLKQILFEYPAWPICSPEYNGSYTALLKNTIDWASRPIKGNPVWNDGARTCKPWSINGSGPASVFMIEQACSRHPSCIYCYFFNSKSRPPE